MGDTQASQTEHAGRENQESAKTALNQILDRPMHEHEDHGTILSAVQPRGLHASEKTEAYDDLVQDSYQI